MGIKERQERDREAVRRAILDAARELFVTEGYQNVSIRKIAERIEYSPAAIYGYFPSKDDIFFALAEEGFRLLGDPGDRADDAAARRRCRRSIASARSSGALYEFSREQPQYFALMFVDRSVPRISREYERFAFAREMQAAHRRRDPARASTPASFPPTVDPAVAMRAADDRACSASRCMRLSDRLAPGENADDLAARRPRTSRSPACRSGVALQSTATPTVRCDAADPVADAQAS